MTAPSLLSRLPLRTTGLIVPLIIVAVLFTIIPRSSSYLSIAGQDRYANHWPLSDNYAIEQTITVPSGRLHQLSLLLVPFGKTPSQGDVVIELVQPDGPVLHRATLPATDVTDDVFESIKLPLSVRIGGEPVTIRLSTTLPRAQSQVAIRFDDEDDPLPSSDIIRGEQVLGGDMALQLARRTNTFGYLSDKLRQQETFPTYLRYAFVAGLLTAALYLAITIWPHVTIRRRHVDTLLLAVALLSLLTFAWRLSFIDQVHGTSGGDPYNFFFIKDRIEQGQFFHPEQKRLPVFPITLIPTQAFTSDIATSARVINQAAAAATLLALALLGRQLKLLTGAILLGVLLAAFSRDALLIPYRPLAYPLVGLLILVSLNALLWARHHPRRLLVAGLFLGLTAQTRHEGILVAGLLTLAGMLILAWQKKWWSVAALALFPALAVVPYFLANLNNFGNPFYVGYLDHPVTNPRRSAHEIEDNIGRAWGVLGSTWRHNWLHQVRLAAKPAVLLFTLLGTTLAFALPAFRARYAGKGHPMIRQGLRIFCTAGAIIIASHIFFYLRPLTPAVSTLFVLSTLIGLLALVSRTIGLRRQHQPRGLTITHPYARLFLVVLAAFTLLGIAIWIHPRDKQLVSFIPYFGFLAGIGIYQLLQLALPAKAFSFQRSALPALTQRWLALSIIFAVLALPLVRLQTTLAYPIDIANRNNAFDWVYYNMGRYYHDHGLSGRVAGELKALAAQYFIGVDNISEHQADDKRPTLADLQARDVRWIMWTSKNTQFTEFLDHPNVETVYTIKTANRDDDLLEGRLLKINETP